MYILIGLAHIDKYKNGLRLYQNVLYFRYSQVKNIVYQFNILRIEKIYNFYFY